MESPLADACHTAQVAQRGQTARAFKHAVRNYRQAAQVTHALQRTALIEHHSATARQFRHIADVLERNAVLRSNCLTVVVIVCKPGEDALPHAGEIRHVANTLQFRASRKCPFADACHVRQVANFLQGSASAKRIVANIDHAIQLIHVRKGSAVANAYSPISVTLPIVPIVVNELHS